MMTLLFWLLAFQVGEPALRISLPIKDLKASDIHDTFNDRRGGARAHMKRRTSWLRAERRCWR